MGRNVGVRIGMSVGIDVGIIIPSFPVELVTLPDGSLSVSLLII